MNRDMKKSILSLATSSILFLSFAPFALAADSGGTGTADPNNTVVSITPPGGIPPISPTQLISFIINAFFAVGILAALIYLLWGGFNWIISGGDKDKIAAARARMIAAIVGLIAIVLSYFILDFVLKLLGLCGINHLVLPTLTGQQANTCPPS